MPFLAEEQAPAQVEVLVEFLSATQSELQSKLLRTLLGHQLAELLGEQRVGSDAPRPGSSKWGLFDCDALGEIPRFVDVAAAHDRGVVGEELERDGHK